jgi:hypothetical protein
MRICEEFEGRHAKGSPGRPFKSMLHAGRRSLAIRSFINQRTCVSPSRCRDTYFTANFPDSSSVLQPVSSLQLSLTRHVTSVIPALGWQVAHKREDYLSQIRRQKLADLLEILGHKDPDPNDVWANYTELLDATRDGYLPIEIHRNILRHCTPNLRAIRTTFVESLRRDALEARTPWAIRSLSPHIHERRFLTIINNIKRGVPSGAGQENKRQIPSLEDYEFVLEHFAVVGHHVGAAKVLQEVKMLGLEPRTRTYYLVLRAIAYRMTLPMPRQDKAQTTEHCSSLALFVMTMVQQRNKGVPSVCMDLTLRVMKDTDDEETFTKLLKLTFGIDLDFLDRHPLSSDEALDIPESFSTATLTTLIDFLGKTKQLSKMVAAFEVLKAPLQLNTQTPQLAKDDDDDDYIIPMDTLARPLPYAQPNTTTYNTLLRRCSFLKGGKVFAKHYLLEALDLHNSNVALLRTQIESGEWKNGTSVVSVSAPKVLVTAQTFLPILSVANKYHDYALTRWVLRHFRVIRRQKFRDYHFYRRFLRRKQKAAAANSSSTELEGERSIPVTTPAPSSLASDFGSFDVASYVQQLRDECDAMHDLNSRVGSSLSRNADRLKERLGKRVWEGKTVYLRHRKRQVNVSKTDWLRMVNFGGGWAVSGRRWVEEQDKVEKHLKELEAEEETKSTKASGKERKGRARLVQVKGGEFERDGGSKANREEGSMTALLGESSPTSTGGAPT